MASRPATLLESILGVEKANACLQEISDRIRPDDSVYFRVDLIREILGKHIQKADPSIRLIMSLMPEDQKEIGRRLVGILVDKACLEVKDDFRANPTR